MIMRATTYAKRERMPVALTPTRASQSISRSTRGMERQCTPTYEFQNPRFGHDFVQVRVLSGFANGALTGRQADGPPVKVPAAPAAAKRAAPTSTKGTTRQEECGTKCGGRTLGNTECEINLQTGLPTGKVTKQIFEKDPCIGPCVDVHETVHATDGAPTCKAVRVCLDKAGKGGKKEDACLDKFQADVLAKIAGAAGTECRAYGAEERCLTARKAETACKGKEAQSRVASDLTRVKCYKKCFCSD